MPVLKDFQCTACEEIFEEFVSGYDKPPCPICKCESDTIYLKAPRAVGADSFNAHYDLQLGQYFKSNEQRKSFLERTGRKSEGVSSPRKSSKSRIICDRKQAERLISGTDLKPGEI